MTDRAMFLAQRETQGVPRDVAQAEWDTRQGELIAQLVAALEPFSNEDDCMRIRRGRCRTLRCLRQAGWEVASGIANGECEHYRARTALAAAKAQGYGGKSDE